MVFGPSWGKISWQMKNVMLQKNKDENNEMNTRNCFLLLLELTRLNLLMMHSLLLLLPIVEVVKTHYLWSSFIRWCPLK